MNWVEIYGTQVLDGKINAGYKIRKQYEKLLNDLANPGKYHFDEDLGNRPIVFIESFCKQAQGKLGAPIYLEPFQKAMIQAAYGFVDDEDIRRYNEILDMIGRKNGKTTVCSGISLYGATSDHEGAPEVYFVATSKDQAGKGYNEANNMIKQSPLLKKKLRKRQSDIYCSTNLGFIKALASNTNSLDGLNTHYGIIDELSAIKNRDLYDLIKQSMASESRRQPMLWEITTNGFVRNSIFDAQYDYAAGVIEGTIEDEHFLPLLYEVDSYEEWFDEECWIKANPGLGTIKSMDKMRQNVQKALQDDTYRPTVIVKDFNLKQNGAAAWLRQEEVENPEIFELSEMSFRYGIGGFDAADSIDLNAAKMLCRRPDDDNIYFLSHYWIPQSKMDEIKNRHHPDDAPYDIWAARGLLTVVDGNKVNKRVFFDWFQMVRDELDIYPLRIGYDPWHIDDSLLNMFYNEFGKDVMVPVRQGVATLSQPMKDLKAEFQAHKIVYNNNPIDKWCFLNTYVKTDINGNIQPAKGNAAKYRIDGMAAALDAYVVYKDNLEEYESLM